MSHVCVRELLFKKPTKVIGYYLQSFLVHIETNRLNSS